MSNNSGGPGRGPPPTTTHPYAESDGAYYTADGLEYFPEGGSYSMGGQIPFDHSAGSYGPGLGQQPTYVGMGNIPSQLAPTGAPGGGRPPMSTFDQGAQWSSTYGTPPANRGPPPTYQTGMSMPVNTPSNYGRGSSSTGALAGVGYAPASVGAPPNLIQGFGPATPAGSAAQPQSYLQVGHGQGYGQEYGPQQQPGNPYLGPRNLSQFHLSTSQAQVGSSNNPGQSVTQAPQPKKKFKRWGLADNERLIHMRNTEGKTFDEIGKELGCTESEASSHYQNLQRMSDAQEEARDRVAALASTMSPVPRVRKIGMGVRWTKENAAWMERRLDTLRRAPENRRKPIHEVLEMVAAEINYVNGTTVLPSTIEGTLSKLNFERSGHRMDWG